MPQAFPDEAADDLFVARQGKAKLEGYVRTLAAMNELIDFAAMADAVDGADCQGSVQAA